MKIKQRVHRKQNIEEYKYIIENKYKNLCSMCDCNKIKNRNNIKLKIQHLNFMTNTIQIKF